MVCLGRPYNFKVFKGCLPQILLGPFFNTLTQMYLLSSRDNKKYNDEKNSERIFVSIFGK